MTDKEILGTIYGWLTQANSRDENPDHTRQRLKDFQSFIEQEWQKRDEGLTEANAKSLGQFSDTWYDAQAQINRLDSEAKRHRELEIGPDGTVLEVK